MSGLSLFPEIPLEIRACRIGSCVNSLTRSLMPYTVTFDPRKLHGADLLRFVDGKGELVCQANSSSSASAESSFFGLDTQAKAKFYGCTASAGFNMALASKSTTSSQGINCFVSYTYKGQSIQLLYQGMSPQTLYGCMTEDFQRYYDAVMNAETIEEYIARYNEFTHKYGHGCVTALHLTAGSAFRIDIEFDSSAQANSQKYGASLAVNTPVGGASAAANWGKEISTATSAASMSLIGQDLPEDAPTSVWCRQMVDKFANKGIDILASRVEVISAPTDPSPPKAPSLPEFKQKPDAKPKPSPKATGSDLPKKLQEALMKEDGYDNWGKYVEAQKKAYEELTAKNVVADAKNIVDDANKASSQAPAIDTASYAPLSFAADISSGLESEGSTSDIWDLGGYIPYAYEVTSWSVLFPDLLVKLPQTFSSVYLAKIYTFYFTRLQFGRYLYFLNDVGAECENDGIESDAEYYASYCDTLCQDIVKSPPSNSVQYARLVEAFEERVRDRRFHSKAAYDAFFSMYEILSESPYGFIPVAGDPPRYPTPRENRPVPSPFSITPMLSDALRYYPVLTPNTLKEKRLKLVYFYDDRWWRATVFKLEQPLSVETDEQGYPYLTQTDVPVIAGKPVPVRLYFAGFGDIPPSATGATVRGLPMFDELPFDEMREFARPSGD